MHRVQNPFFYIENNRLGVKMTARQAHTIHQHPLDLCVKVRRRHFTLAVFYIIFHYIYCHI